MNTDIKMSDISIETFCPKWASLSSSNSGVRMIHAPTGLKAESSDQRSQHKNKEKAWDELRSKIEKHGDINE